MQVAVVTLVLTALVLGQRLELKEGSACKRVAGVEWNCRKLSRCAKAREMMKQGKKPDVCSYSGSEAVVCCQPFAEDDTFFRGPDGSKYEDTGASFLQEGDTCKREAGQPWTCTRLRFCSYAQELIKKGKKPAFCRPNGKEVVVCCNVGNGLVTEPSFVLPPDPSPSPTLPPAPPATTELPGLKSYRMCHKYSSSVTPDMCTSTVPQVVNGKNANPKEFPHMAMLGSGEPIGSSFCGGSLISDRWILTAAHCTSPDGNGPEWARLGDYDVLSTNDDDRLEAKPVIHKIIDWQNHPAYEPRFKKWDNDIALYKLDKRVEFNQFIRPICLHVGFEVLGKSALISGWGKVDYDGATSSLLQKGNVSLVPGNECIKKYRPANRTVNLKTIICTDSLQDTTVCLGDSGGPLQYRLDDCMYSQIGVTSLGSDRCQVVRYPALYTRVSHYISWIESVVWPYD